MAFKNNFIDTPRYPRPFAEAVNGAFSALFEGLSPSQKTRRAIRGLIQPPPDGWDAPALNQDGKPVKSRNGNVLSWIVALETYIRDSFFHDPNVNDKFEPGVARIAYTDLGMWPENVEDYTDTPRVPRDALIPQFRAILRMLSGAHSDEYDFDLNGMTLDDMVERFGNRRNAEEVDDTEDTGHTDYEIVRIDTPEQAAEYRDCWEDNPGSLWCIVDDPAYFRRYTKRGKNTQYFLLAPGYRDVKPEPGKDAPKDRYGLSMIGVTVGPDGSVEDCCTRWNHQFGGSDHTLSEKELSQILGRPFRTLCPPSSEIAARRTPSAESIIARLDAGENPETIYDSGMFIRTSDELGGLAMRYNVDDDEHTVTLFVDKKSLRPIWPLDLYEYFRLDDECIVGVTLSDETDAYGEDIKVYWLLRRDGEMCGLGSSDMEDTDDESTLLHAEITDAHKTCIPGVYRLEGGYNNGGTEVLVSRDFQQQTDWHYEIDIYENDHIIACDLDRDYNKYDRNDGSPQVIFYKDSKDMLELLGPEAFDKMHGEELVKLYAEYPDNGRINIAFQLDSRVYAISHGKLAEIASDVNELDTIDTSRLEGLLYIEYDGPKYDILDINGDTPRFIQRGLSSIDDSGIYSTEEGTQNMLAGDGSSHFKDNWAEIEPPTKAISPMDAYVARLHDGKGNVYFYDRNEQTMVYDKPLPDGKDILPYTGELYTMTLDDGKVAIFSLDGEQRSPEFARVSLQQYPFLGTVVELDEGDDHRRAIVDIRTGKFIATDLVRIELVSTTWPNAAGMLSAAASKVPLVRKDSSPYAQVYVLVRADNKATVAAFHSLVWKLAPFGWVDKLSFFRDIPLVCVDDRVYDLELGQFSPWPKDETIKRIDDITKAYTDEHGKSSDCMLDAKNAMHAVGNWIKWSEQTYAMHKQFREELERKYGGRR